MLNSPNPPKLTQLESGVYFCADDPGEPGTHAQRWSVNDAEGELIGALCNKRTVLEIGTGLGVSTRHLAQYAEHVYTCDVDEWVYQNIFPLLDLPNVTCLKSVEDVPTCNAAFIDGRHTAEEVEADTRKAIAKMTGEWIIVYHDSKIAGVRNGARKVFSRWLDINTFAGIAVARKEHLRNENQL